jgi:rRNA-processing protein FCF1
VIPADRLDTLTAPLLSLADCILLASVSRSDALATADEPLLRVARTEGVSVRRLAR